MCITSSRLTIFTWGPQLFNPWVGGRLKIMSLFLNFLFIYFFINEVNNEQVRQSNTERRNFVF